MENVSNMSILTVKCLTQATNSRKSLSFDEVHRQININKNPNCHVRTCYKHYMCAKVLLEMCYFFRIQPILMQSIHFRQLCSPLFLFNQIN